MCSTAIFFVSYMMMQFSSCHSRKSIYIQTVVLRHKVDFFKQFFHLNNTRHPVHWHRLVKTIGRKLGGDKMW